jgi:hypothetical protein
VRIKSSWFHSIPKRCNNGRLKRITPGLPPRNLIPPWASPAPRSGSLYIFSYCAWILNTDCCSVYFSDFPFPSTPLQAQICPHDMPQQRHTPQCPPRWPHHFSHFTVLPPSPGRAYVIPISMLHFHHTMMECRRCQLRRTRQLLDEKLEHTPGTLMALLHVSTNTVPDVLTDAVHFCPGAGVSDATRPRSSREWTTRTPWCFGHHLHGQGTLAYLLYTKYNMYVTTKLYLNCHSE